MSFVIDIVTRGIAFLLAFFYGMYISNEEDKKGTGIAISILAILLLLVPLFFIKKWIGEKNRS